MARFYASIRGSRGEATRMGTTQSGISGHIRGWDVGGEVRCYVGENGEDRVAVFLTSGSNGHGQRVLLGDYTANDLNA
jgi:hypothetical protein